MHQSVSSAVEKRRKQRRRRRVWTRIVSIMACLVVFCTTYALILPAITQENEVTCTLEEHTHDENCYKTTVTENLICTKQEIVHHEHTDECYELVEAAAPAANSEAVDLVEESASEEEVSQVNEDRNAGQSVEESSSAGVVLEKVLVCTKPEQEVHEHTKDCYETSESDPTLDCDKKEHIHGLACYADMTADVETAAVWEQSFADAELTGVWNQDVISIAKTQLGYVESSKNYVVESKEEADGTIEETTKGYTRYGAWYGDAYGDWCAMFVSFCLNYTGVEGMPLEAYCPTWIEKLSAEDVNLYHNTGSYIPEAGNLVFFDWDADGESDHVGIVSAVNSNTEEGVMQIETIEGNSNNRVAAQNYPMTDETIMGFAALPYQLSEEEQAEVDRVIAMIDEMPSADEIDAKVEEFYEAEDEDGEIAYLEKTYQQVARVYHYYNELSDIQKEHVTNADKLLELEYIWSVTTYIVSDRNHVVPVYQVNEYSCNDPLIAWGGTVGEKVRTTNTTMDYSWWVAVIVEEDENGQLYVANIYPAGTNVSKLNCKADTERGFVLLVWKDYAILDVAIGDTVSVDFNYQVQGYDTTCFGHVAFNHLQSNGTSTVEGVHTSDFVELNIYDYYGADTAAAAGKKNINTLWSGNKKYPGFQWNGGAYMTSSSFLPSRVDNIDFGNSMITDFNYGSNGGSVTNGITANYQHIGRQGGLINEIVQDSKNYWANYPTGISHSVNVLRSTLLNGYPALVDNTSLNYLFTENTYAAKKNVSSIDGLFQYDTVSGEYWFDSRKNHAYYSNDEFTLYNQIITPNFILYPFGNFLPFDSITNPNKVTRVTDIDHVSGSSDGTVTGYMQMIRSRLQEGGMNVTEDQLYDMLGRYQNSLSTSNQANWKAEDAINYYFQNSSEFKSAFANSGMNFNTTPTLQTLLDRLYNVDFDVKKNFFFGMEMKMDFMQPKGGMTGNDITNDGQSDFPMEFYFAGDDDVWVYIDDILFLDLTGIHRHVGGKIDFVNGIVSYYSMESYIDGKVTEYPYDTMTFAEILVQNGGISEAKLGEYLKYENGQYTTFKDYSTHSFNFYYMERGSGSSVCCINFNFPLLKKNSISVTKENITVNSNNQNIDADALGNPDYYFNIMGKNDAGSSYLFIGPSPNSQTGIDRYKIKDVDGSILKNEDGTDKVFKTDQWGIFTLKAGQTAIFEGIPENAGQYYVQELIKEKDNAQYPNVYVNDIVTQFNGIINWGTRKYYLPVGDDVEIGPQNSKWYGRSGHFVDSGQNSSFYFEQQNHLNVDLLGSLAITKKVEGEKTDKVFEMEVLMDGVKIPIGTKYKIGDTDCTVNTEGIISIQDGQTAVLPNIISGTAFTVREVNGGDYTVTYKSENEETSVDGSSISGIIRVNTQVAITVINAEQGAKVSIPVTKSFRVTGGTDTQHKYTFTLEQVTDRTGNTVVENGIVLVHTAEFTGNDYSFVFDLSYLKHNISGSSKQFYYKIMETEVDETSLLNDQKYIVEVTVEKTDDGLRAAVTNCWSGDGEQGADEVAFVNTLTGSLDLEKLVSGLTDADRDAAVFNFKLYLSEDQSGMDELPATYKAVLTQATGEQENVDLKLVDGAISLINVHHGETVSIRGIPIGTTWKIVEENSEGYNVTTQVIVNGETQLGGGIESSGSIVLGDTEVIYTNTAGYELPESGGTGITLYTMAGLMLVLCSAAFLLYRYQKRRKEAN